MAALTTLLAPNARRYVVEPGVIDSRSALAFTNGHCHSLAVALRRETGGEIVGFARNGSPFEHVLTRARDGSLLDIGGARTPRDVTRGGGRLSGIDSMVIDVLVDELGWVAPDPDAASAWVPAVLERASKRMPHFEVGCLARDFPVEGVLDVHVEWSQVDGAVRLTAFGQPIADPRAPWVRCGVLSIPEDPQGERLIDFCQMAFDGHADRLEAAIRRRPGRYLALALNPSDPQQPEMPPNRI